MTIAIIIPTFQEESNIAELIQQIRAETHEAVESIIVVDGGSTDKTLQIAHQTGAMAVLSPMRGRAAQMNYGAKQTTADILYFVHADTRLPKNFVSDIKQAIAEGYEAGCYRFRFDSDRLLLQINSYFTRFDSLTVRGGDQTLFIKRSLFEKLGGFDEYYVIMEEYDLLRRLWKNHKNKFKLIPKSVVVSARKYQHNSWLRVQIANLVAMSMFRLGVAPTKIAKTYKRMLR